MSYDVGTAHLQVIPRFDNIEKLIGRESLKWGQVAGKAFGDKFNQTVGDQTRDTKVGPDRAPAQRQGQESGGAFADGFKKRVEASLKSLPDVKIGAATGEAEQKLRDLQTQLRDLSNKRIGVDLDGGTALSEINRIEHELTELGRSSPNVQVRIDAAAAASQLLLLSREVSALDGRDVDIDVNADASRAVAQMGAVQSAVHDASSGISMMSLLGAGIGPAIVPGAAAAAAAMLSLGATAGVAAAAMATIGLGFSGVSDAVKALEDAEKDAEDNAKKVAKAQEAVADAVRGVKQAEDGVTDARRAGALAVSQAAKRVVEAQRDVLRAEKDAAEAAEEAAQRVVDAQQNVTDARRQAAEAVAEAGRRVTDAENDLAQAQEEATRVTRDLTQARQDYREEMEDLDSSIKSNALAQAQANLDVQKSQAELNKVLMDPKASEFQREQARITYERQVLSLSDLQTRGKRLAKEQEENAKKGVEGSDQVVAARDRIARAEDRISDAQKKVADAVRDQDKARATGAKRVEDAERALAKAVDSQQKTRLDGIEKVQAAQDRVAEARAGQQEAERKAQASVAKAQEAVIEANRRVAKAQKEANEQGIEGAKKLQEALADYGPTTIAFAKFIHGLKDQFKDLRETAAAGLLPPIQSALERLLASSGGRLRTFVGNVASSVGQAASKALDSLSGPSFQKFFGILEKQAGPTLNKLADAAINIAEGFTDILSAFAPFNSIILGGIVKLTEKFAAWARTLDQTQGFKDFMSYVIRVGPQLVSILTGAAQFMVKLIEAAAPIGEAILGPIQAIIDLLNALPTGAVTALATAFIAVAGAVKLINLAFAAKTGIANFQGKLSSIAGSAKSVTGAAGLGGITSFLGGPWGIALGAAAIGVGYLTQKHEEQKAKIKGLVAGLTLLGTKYRELAKNGQEAGDAAATAFADLVRNNPELQDLVRGTNDLGISLTDLARDAASGSVKTTESYGKITGEVDRLEARQQVLRRTARQTGIDLQGSALEEFNANTTRIDKLKDLKEAYEKNAGEIKKQIDLENILTNDINEAATATTKMRTVQEVMTDSTIDATTKANVYRLALEDQTGSKIKNIEATELAARKDLDWKGTLSQLSTTLQQNKGKIDLHSKAGLDNRDALQQAATKIRDMTLANINAGQPLDVVTKKHDKRRDALINEAVKAGVTRGAAKDLINTYAGVPSELKTKYVSTDFQKVYADAQKMFFIQDAVRRGLDPATAEGQWKSHQQALKNASTNPFAYQYDTSRRAYGGPITGPGTSTSDSIPALLSDGEWVHRASAVDYYGPHIMDALNRRQIPRDIFQQRFAFGGQVRNIGQRKNIQSKKYTVPLDVNWKKVFTFTQAQAIAIAQKQYEQQFGAATGQGWQWQMETLRKKFPGLALWSGYYGRQNARTLSGGRSYHSRGLAVDVAPRRDVATYIANNFRAGTKELITPWRDMMLWNGKPHKFSAAVERQHGVGSAGNDHVHWAYMSPGGGGNGVTGDYEKGAGAAAARSWIQQAMRAVGVSGPAWLNGLMTLVKRESNYNPRAINNWDSNARAGHPSQGLAQTIPSTFQAYRLKSLPNDILNPISNVAAAIRYIMSRYGGSATNPPRLQQMDPNRPPKGYDSGGFLPPGYSTVFNGTGKPEPVFTDAQWQLMQNGGMGKGGGMTIILKNDEGNLIRFVDAKIDSSYGTLTDAVVYNSK